MSFTALPFAAGFYGEDWKLFSVYDDKNIWCFQTPDILLVVSYNGFTLGQS